jgi:hypothetical protein
MAANDSLQVWIVRFLGRGRGDGAIFSRELELSGVDREFGVSSVWGHAGGEAQSRDDDEERR